MPYQITLQPSGFTFEAKKNETVLDAALRQGVALNSGCRRGICGVCIGKLLSGSITYIDNEEPIAFFDEDAPENKIVICEAMPDSDLVLELSEIDSPNALEIKNLLVEVTALESLSDTIIKVSLELPEDEFLQFLAGQTIAIIFDDTRKYYYSLASASHDQRHIELHIDTRLAGNRFIHETAIGDTLRIEGPSGDFFIRDKHQCPSLFICENTGFAAIKSMLEHSIARGSTQPLHVFRLGEKQDDFYLSDLVDKWTNKYENIHCTAVIDLALEQLVLQISQETGHDLADTEIYLSGTAPMVDTLEFELLSQGVPPARIHHNRF
jgi:CDP-4-dehydro-6-deoxyglucose reductase